AHQLQLIDSSNATLSSSYVLGGNVDASATIIAAASIASTYSGMWAITGFVPLGTDGTGIVLNSGNGFTGSFNGQNFTINNLNVNRPNALFDGLFGYAGTSAIISNTGIVGGGVAGKGYIGDLIGANHGTVNGDYATGAVTATTNFDTGGLIGQNLSGSITNSYATGAVTGSAGGYTGGLVGYNDTSISNSYATGAVNGGTGLYTGGLIGAAGTANSLNNSYATGSVTSSFQYVGGLIGRSRGLVTNSYATGAVSGSANVGGLVGVNNGTLTNVYALGAVISTGGYQGGLVGYNASTINNAYATGSITGASTTRGAFAGYNAAGSTISNVYYDNYTSGLASVGSILGTVTTVVSVTSNPASSAATNYAYNASSYANLTASAWVFLAGNTTRPFLATEVPTTGNVPVTASGAFVISNAHQLQLINDTSTTLGASYVLGGKIDLSQTSAVVSGTPSSYSGMWAGTGWVPLGTDGAGTTLNSGSGFSGSFNGQGYSINNMVINRPSIPNVGWIGYAGSTATISNVGIVGGSVSGNSAVGDLVGLDVGQIINSYATGAVSGGDNVGGLGGYAAFSASISKSYATGAVSGTIGYVGGLVGQSDGGPISQSYATGAVTDPGNTSGPGYGVGGLVGYNRGSTVTQSYATGALSATGFQVG
ncbi:MAG: hypothetical protein KGJ05_07450, partial [Alphaproteobacteria bacterium]|nr:hypothetical protein [Alphaproteobacteria bacterium]